MPTARLNFQLRAKLVVIKVAEKGRPWKEFKEFKKLKSLNNLFAGLAGACTLPIFLKVAFKFKTKKIHKKKHTKKFGLEIFCGTVMNKDGEIKFITGLSGEKSHIQAEADPILHLRQTFLLGPTHPLLRVKNTKR